MVGMSLHDVRTKPIRHLYKRDTSDEAIQFFGRESLWIKSQRCQEPSFDVLGVPEFHRKLVLDLDGLCQRADFAETDTKLILTGTIPAILCAHPLVAEFPEFRESALYGR